MRKIQLYFILIIYFFAQSNLIFSNDLKQQIDPKLLASNSINKISDNIYFDVSKLQYSANLENSYLYYFDATGKKQKNQLVESDFINSNSIKNLLNDKFNAKLTNGIFWIKFYLINTDSTSHEILIKTKNKKEIVVNLMKNEELIFTKKGGYVNDLIIENDFKSKHLFAVDVKAHDTLKILASLKLYPDITSHDISLQLYDRQFHAQKLGSKNLVNTYRYFSFASVGILIFVIIYVVSKFFLLSEKEYIYYAVYLFCFLLFFGQRLLIEFSEEYYLNTTKVQTNLTFINFSFIFYLLFTREFLELKNTWLKLYKIITIAILCIAIYTVIDLTLYFTLWQEFKHFCARSFNILLFMFSIVMITAAFYRGKTIMNYFAFGTLMMSTGAITSLILSMRGTNYIDEFEVENIFEAPLFYLNLGILIEILLFNLGLSFKQKLIQIKKVEAEFRLNNELELKRFNQLSTIVRTQEEERLRIAKDLHDDVGAQLSALKMFVSVFTNPKKSTLEKNKLAIDSALIINQTIDDIRHILMNLSPKSLDEYGYAAAIKELAHRITTSTEIEIYLHLENDLILNKQVEISLFRITQELFNNSIKHASAKKITLQLIYRNNLTVLMYEDDGIGFNIQMKSDGFGLKNIETRVTLLGGIVELDSSAGRGIRYVIEIPMPINKI